MDIDAKKLSLIERFMKIRKESAINQLELAITQIEMQNRVESSLEDIENERVRTYEDFSNEIKQWIAKRKTTR